MSLPRKCGFRKTFVSFLSFFILSCPAVSFAAGADDFRTAEYQASTGLESIGAAEAYALGFTGQGVVVAVVDSFFAPERNEFAGKYPYGTFIFGNEELDDDHGIHVAGIVAAAKNDYGMHGVAFDAKLLQYAALGDVKAAYEGLLSYPDVRIINNSWGKDFHLDTTYADNSAVYRRQYAENSDLIDLSKKLVAQDRLFVFVAGNEGHLSPVFIFAGLPTVLDRMGISHNLANNWISVSAFDSSQLSGSAAFIPMFSNMGKDASEYTLLAPGNSIYSTISDRTYDKYTGTSMASPHVAGAAALISSAFPYMGGKQLADVLFSTATKLTVANSAPRFIVLRRLEFDENEERLRGLERLIVYKPTSFTAPLELTAEEKESMLSLWRGGDEAPFDVAFADAVASAVTLSDAEYESLFGQGMLNAAKAVRGPGYFDAKRLSASDCAVIGGNPVALYTVDTKGYDSTWSNDIGQMRAASGDLAGLDVGLRKQGNGILYLTGQNTYQGATLAEGGVLSLGKAGYLSRASLVGDVYVMPSGTFIGNGLVGGNLVNHGALFPGLVNVAGSQLEVAGEVTLEHQSETIFAYGKNQAANTLKAADIVVKSDAVFAVMATPETLRPYSQDTRMVLTATNSLKWENPEEKVLPLSAFLTFSGEPRGHEFWLDLSTKPLTSLDLAPLSQQVASRLESMYHHLSDSDRQREMDFLYFEDARRFSRTAASLRGDIHAATLTALPLSRLLRPAVTSGPGISATPFNASACQGDDAKAGREKNCEEGAGVWLRPLYGHARLDGRREIGQSGVGIDMAGVAAGVQEKRGAWLYGAFGAFGYSSLDQGSASSANIRDYRLGVYGGYEKAAFAARAMLNGGIQTYRTTRSRELEKQTTFRSNFNGSAFSGAVDVSYDVFHGLSELFSLKPYLAWETEYLHQDSRRENSGNLFALSVNSKSLTRNNAYTGLRFGYKALADLKIEADAGYRRMLSGDAPSMTAAFAGMPYDTFTVAGSHEKRNAMTFGVGIESAPNSNWSIALRFYGEKAGSNEQYTGFLNLGYRF